MRLIRREAALPALFGNLGVLVCFARDGRWARFPEVDMAPLVVSAFERFH